MPRCLVPHLYPPHGFPLRYMSSYLSRPWLLHAAALIRFQRTLLSEILLKRKPEKSPSSKRIDKLSYVIVVRDAAGLTLSAQSRSGYHRRQLTVASTWTGFIHALCGRRLLVLQDAQNMEHLIHVQGEDASQDQGCTHLPNPILK